MSKTFKKSRRDGDYYGEYDEYSDNNSKKQSRKKENRRSKYFDEIETYESHSKFNFKTQKYRY